MAGKILTGRQLNVLRGQLHLTVYYAMSKIPSLRKPYVNRLLREVRRTGLFDAEYYLAENGDIAQQKLFPLRHYVAYGDKEGRAPMPFFDPAYYRAQCRSRLKKVNSLLHYFCVGQHLGLSPSPWFDVEFYLSIN